MRRVRGSTTLASLALIVSVVSPVTSPVAPVRAASGALAEAIGRMPVGTTDMGFTDWARIRASVGAEDVTGASSLDDKIAVLLTTNQHEAAGSAFGAAYLRHHHDTWGWDTLDVEWEALYSVDGPPVTVVRLREGVDTAAIAARYDERGFSTRQAAGATIRSHELDPSTDWFRSGELGISNTAFLDDGRTLAFSSGRDTLEAALTTAGSALIPGAAGVIDALGEPSAAWIVFGASCPAFTPLPFDPLDPDASIAPLPTGPALHPWTALGIAYERPDWQPIGRIAMGFLDPAHAEADLAPRSAIARDGLSTFLRRPYAEALFALDRSEVTGEVLTLHVSPVDDRPTRLFQMLQTRDMAFAGC